MNNRRSTIKPVPTENQIKGRFQKGICPNPNGRPKGSLNVYTKEYNRIKGLAAEKYEEAFRILWEAVKANESWAHQLFFKELVPKNYKYQTVFIKKLMDKDKNMEGAINVRMDALAEFDEVTQPELLDQLKVLNSLKVTDKLVEQEVIRESRESLIEKVQLIEKIMEFEEKE